MTCLNKDQSTSYIFVFLHVCCLASQTNTKTSVSKTGFHTGHEGFALVYLEELFIFKMGIFLHVNMYRYSQKLPCFRLD